MSCTINVSIGELFDKYTILEIKSDKVTDKMKLDNVNKEISYLKPKINQYKIDNNIIKELKETNEKLWKIEDDIRNKENKKEFDDEFIQLARQVYITNDKRFEIKNKINVLLKSDINEIKNYSKYNENINYKELGETYEKKKLFKKAIDECYLKIIKIEPNNGVILNQIGVCYFNLGEFKLAIEFFKKVILIKEIVDVYCNIATCYTRLKDYKNAEINLLDALKIENNNMKVFSGLAEIYFYNKDYDKSIKYYNLCNNNDVLKYNTSFPYLAKKDFSKGLELYEYRLKNNNINYQTGLNERVNIPLEYWDGIKNCDSLLIVYEQGIGDNIQYFRFIIELADLYPNMKITYFAKDIVTDIFVKYKNIIIVKDMIFFNNYNYKIYIMSLPKILNKTIIHPNTINYININDEKLLYWKNKLSQLTKLKVGFVYNGLLSSFIEKYIPLKEFKILANDVDLICIHKQSDIEKDIKDIDFKITYFDIDKEPFQDTIHILKNIDLLITIDTFIVHLAGVLDVPTWLLLGYSDWRWSNESKTYWYDSIEILRTDKEFKTILEKVKLKLVNL